VGQAEQLDPAGVERAEIEHALDEGGLARAVDPRQAEELAALDRDVDRAQDRTRAIAFHDPRETGHRLSQTIFPVMSSAGDYIAPRVRPATAHARRMGKWMPAAAIG
jgi:hypothetical protein